MATIFGIHIGSKFGSTKKYEATINRQQQEYERYLELEKSDLLKRYETLDAEINSSKFKNKVHYLKSARFKDSEEWHQLNQYKSMAASSDIKTYLKLTKSGQLHRINKIKESDLLKEFNDLKIEVSSSTFQAAKAAKTKKEFKKSEEFIKLHRYKTLSKDADIKFYLKKKNSSDYRLASKLENSERLQTFKELEGLIQSAEYIEKRTFLLDRNRFKKSDEFTIINEFKELSKNNDVKWFLYQKKINPFKEISKWELTFEDGFDGLNLDTNKWMNGYYWGKALINDSYVLAGEKQFFRNENIDILNSQVRITTQQEKFRGKVWDTVQGFTINDFNYTSGLISTGQSFRQKYGKFEAKVKFTQSNPVINAFWMVGEKRTPHIDIFKSSGAGGKSIDSGLFISGEDNELLQRNKKTNGVNFKNKYFIYTFEWTPKILIWKINGQEIHRETKYIPNEAMYLTFCTILTADPKESQLPAYMDIDWIRCYKKKEQTN